MQEFLSLRAFSDSQNDLMAFLESSFPKETRIVNERSASLLPASKCVETRVPLNSEAFQRIKDLIERREGIDGYQLPKKPLLKDTL